MKRDRLFIIAALALLLGACGQAAAPEADTAPETEATTEAVMPTEAVAAPKAEAEDHIAWYDGDVESAFAYAKSEGKPLFLYWGAVWCPPCYYLKHTVFQRPEVMEKIHQFVPVYMDGDMEDAQIWGEEYDVQGYPTTILFTPDGTEFRRMPSALEAEAYAGVLEQALADMRPVKDAYEAAMAAEPGAADPKDLAILAYYAWDQDSQLDLEDADKLAAYKALWEKTPEDMALEKSRFLMRYLVEAVSQWDEESGEPVFPAEERAGLAAAMTAVLDDPEQRQVNFSDFMYWSREMAAAFHPEDGPERQAFVDHYAAVMEAAEDDTSLAYEQRIGAMFPALELYRLQNPAAEGEEVVFPDELKARIKDKVMAADAAVTDEGVRQSLMSDLSWILQDAGMNEEAEALLTASMEKSVAPYYFMSDMADLVENDGRTEEAISWYKRAYESTDAEAEGGMTRFRWGYSYLRSLLRMTPEDDATIQAESERVLGELLAHDDAFALGNKDRLNSLAGAYNTWNEEGAHEETVQAIRDFVAGYCANYAAEGEDSLQSRCQAYLAPEEAAEE